MYVIHTHIRLAINTLYIYSIQATDGLNRAQSTITSKVVVYALAERVDVLSLFLLYPYMYSVLITMYKE
jgi:hypothetical protein